MSTIARLRAQFADSPDVEAIRAQAYKIARYTHRIRDRFLLQAFEQLGARDRLAAPLADDVWFSLLQHYGWLTHYLDVTLDFEVALWFALLKNDRKSLAVMYAVDLDVLPSTVRSVDHSTLKAQPYSLLNCRWVTQMGAMLVPVAWPDMTAAECLDLRALEFASSVHRFEFAPAHGDAAKVPGDLMASQRDWIAPVVQNAIRFVASGVEAHHPVVREYIDKIG